MEGLTKEEVGVLASTIVGPVPCVLIGNDIVKKQRRSLALLDPFPSLSFPLFPFYHQLYILHSILFPAQTKSGTLTTRAVSNALGFAGMPLGEMFDLEKLAKTCREKNRWTFFVTSSPANCPRGVSSHANAQAIF